MKTYDTNLVLFKHPMDYNEIQKPAVYIDPSLPDSITPYFATVPVGYDFGSTPYEILQELFLTEPLDDEDEEMEGSQFILAKKASRVGNSTFAYLKNQGLTPAQLEATALLNSGKLNSRLREAQTFLAKESPLDMDNIVAWSLPFVSTWRPSGTLKYYDEQDKKDMPLVGVRVTAGYSYYWRSSTTNANGYFESPEKWTFSVDYEANFDNDQFLLQDGHSWYGEDLEIEKNNTRSAWNTTFTGDHAKWCVVWAAAYNYWYGDRGGLQHPRQNGWLNHSLEINVYYKNDKDYESKYGKDKVGMYSYSVVSESIAIKAYNRAHLQLYSTTTHEIAHSSHYANNGIIAYDSRSSKLKETYAKGIEKYLTQERYKIPLTLSYDYQYTGLFEDLEDANGQTAPMKDGTAKAAENVSGFSAPQLEKAVFKSTSWSNLRDNLKKDYPNGTGGKISYTPADMDALFDYWGK